MVWFVCGGVCVIYGGGDPRRLYISVDTTMVLFFTSKGGGGEYVS